MTMLPMPTHRIPLWLAADSDTALARTTRIADGWHGTRYTPETVAPVVRRLRAERPGPDFTVSLRVEWNGRDQGVLADKIAAFAAAGVDHVMIAPTNREVDDWDEVIEGVGRHVAG
jgi:alkanesulfonate monooxygenase SsuD/methylene tetrahydromethanopterin reductase-like flavin-dependent oxidoreductase (luciferase family)